MRRCYQELLLSAYLTQDVLFLNWAYC
uniref:Uncharacterized protein n=1 Tax=Arundo donax TaxID=35708 RepID=A0A0A8Z0M3_ARUDO